MTLAVSDTGYWLAEATGDDVSNVFDAEEEEVEHHHTPQDVAGPRIENPSIKSIRNILTPQNSTGDSGDVRDFQEEDVAEVPADSLDPHPDPSPDATYTTRPRRTLQPSQKILLNNKWSDTKIWAQRAIAHTKYDKTLEAERLYCRLATVSQEDPDHYNFDPDFDLVAAV